LPEKPHGSENQGFKLSNDRARLELDAERSFEELRFEELEQLSYSNLTYSTLLDSVNAN